MKLRYAMLGSALIVFILVSVLVTYRVLDTKTPVSSEGPAASPFYVGIEFGYGNVSDCKLLIDKVKNYTNLLVVSSTNITQNEALLNETCNYAYHAGMHMVIYFPQSFHSSSGSGVPFLWTMKAKDTYGSNFLGAYVYDETGGKVLDRALGATSIYYTSADGGSYTQESDYRRFADNFIANAHDQMDAYLYCAKKADTSVMTADYGLYWFDYRAGYDTVLAEFGWGNNRQMAIALCRGAAAVQGKDWGAIVCWEQHTTGVGRLENGPALYNDLMLAYTNGAKYAVIFDYAGKNETSNQDLPNPYPYGILTDEHFAALENFWSYIQQNPEKHGSTKATASLVLPQYYGFGFRSVDDKIWGLDQANVWTTKMWNDANNLLNEYGGNLDIVYSDPEFRAAISEQYSTVIPWASGSANADYPVINLNTSFGYNSIQSALSNGATVSGDTLLVKSGTYKENIRIDKPIVLLGENKDRTVIDGGNNGSTVVINSANVTLQGFTIKNGNPEPIQSINLTAQLMEQALRQYGYDSGYLGQLDPNSVQNLVITAIQAFKRGVDRSAVAGSGIYLSNADNCVLADNLVTNCTYGVVLASSGNTTLRNNSLMNNKYGFGVSASESSAMYLSAPARYDQNIDDSNTVNGKPICYWTNKNGGTVPADAGYVALVNCSSVTMENLQLAGNFNGLLIANTHGSTIRDNMLADNYEGLRIVESADSIYQNNNIDHCFQSLSDDSPPASLDSSNRINGKPLYIWVNQHDRTVPGDAGFVALTNCSGIVVQNLNLTGNSIGLLLQDSRNCTISSNAVANMKTGIELVGCDEIVVVNNTVDACVNGMLLNTTDKSSVRGNTVSDNTNSGAFLQLANSNIFESNMFSGNINGVLLLDSSNNTLKGNILQTNQYGLDFSASSSPTSDYSAQSSCTSNVVVENNITLNMAGITVNSNVLGNVFYRNNFVNNTQQTYSNFYNFFSSEPANTWDNGKEGNYWSNYNGTDADHNGIGDQPLDVFPQYEGVGMPQRPISADTDHFPLMQVYVATKN